MSLNSSRPSRTGLFGAARGCVPAGGTAQPGTAGGRRRLRHGRPDHQPYTPAEGINVDVGDPGDPKTVVHVRNLLIVSKAPGEGIVSASLVTDGRDS